MSTPTIPMYTHRRLPNDEAIRVLKVGSAPEDQANIECHLLVISPRDGPEVEGRSYEALSWTWGSERPKRTIRLHQEDRLSTDQSTVFHFKVSENLYDAIRALRWEHKPRYLWIDAICIDQDDIAEKNKQVPRMDAIYGGAENVCIWLGNESKNSGQAIEFIQKSLLELWDFDQLCDDLEKADLWKALVDLMKRSWFSRRWVVQEIALARVGTVYCGKDHIDWHKFANAVSLFVEVESASKRLSEVVRKHGRYDHLPNFFGDVPTLGAAILVETTSHLFRTSPTGTRERLSSLENLVSRLPVFAVTEPRDTIYALLAMAKDSNPRRTNAVESYSSTSDRPGSASALGPGVRTPIYRNEFHRYALHALIHSLRPLARLSKPLQSWLWERERRLRKPLTDEEARQLLEKIKRRLRTPEQEAYEVDYEQSVVEVYRQFIAFSIRKSDQTRALDIICRPWAPAVTNRDEWRFLKESRGGHEVPKIQLHSREELKQKIDLPTWIPSVNGAAFIMTEDKRALEGDDHSQNTQGNKKARHFTQGMKRMNADSLVGSPDAPFKNYSAAGTRTVNRKKLHFKKRRDHYSMFVEGFILDAIKHVHGESQGGRLPRKWLTAVGCDNLDENPPGPRWDAFWRTIVADRGPKGSNPPPFYPLTCLETLRIDRHSATIDTQNLIDHGKCSIVAQFLRRVQSTIWQRQLVETVDECRLGLTGTNVREGDKVCILYGCSVPVILRERRKEDQQMADDKADDLEIMQKRGREAARWIRESQKRRLESGVPLKKRRRALWRRIYDARDLFRLFWFVGSALYIWLRDGELRSASVFVLATFVPLMAEVSNVRLSRLWTDASEQMDQVLTGLGLALLLFGFYFLQNKVPRSNVSIAVGCIFLYPGMLPQNVRSAASDAWWNASGRKMKKPIEEEIDKVYYEFIGEAYIHGMMNGEAIGWQNETRTMPKTFELR